MGARGRWFARLLFLGAFAGRQIASAHRRYPSKFYSAVVLDGLDVQRFNADGLAKLSVFGELMLILKDDSVDSTGVRAFDRDYTFAVPHVGPGDVQGGTVRIAYNSRQRCKWKRNKMIRALDDGRMERLLQDTESHVLSKCTVNVAATRNKVIASTCSGGGRIENEPELSDLDIGIIVALAALLLIIAVMLFLLWRKRRREALEDEQQQGLVGVLPEYEMSDSHGAANWAGPTEELDFSASDATEDSPNPARRRNSASSTGVAII